MVDKDIRECANCGRFQSGGHGCGKYVYTCMQDGDAYSHWIPKEDMKRNRVIHELKILPVYFDAVISGIKNFELRKDDRNYQIGDFIVLKEWKNGEYTGREAGFQIEYILRDCAEYGLIDGYCILGW